MRSKQYAEYMREAFYLNTDHHSRLSGSKQKLIYSSTGKVALSILIMLVLNVFVVRNVTLMKT